jgi:phage baseplate assembly protein W
MHKDVIGQGWPFPVGSPQTQRLARADGGEQTRQAIRLRLVGGDEKIRQSIWLILSTAPGERQMLPEFGCGIHELVFEANTAAMRGVLAGKVRDALARWEPRIDVLDVRVDAPPEARNYLLIRVDYRVRANNSFYNLVYPFFVNEGAG